jgi:threonine dehydrogenase-like Zn-dependent dehydrogenase
LHLLTHRFQIDRIDDAYAIFGQVAKTGAIKVLIEA